MTISYSYIVRIHVRSFVYAAMSCSYDSDWPCIFTPKLQ